MSDKETIKTLGEIIKNHIRTNEFLESKQKKLTKCLSMLMRSMLVHPDCTEGSEFDDMTSEADELLKSINT